MESTLLEAMLEAAQRCGAAFSSTAETGSATDALIDSDLQDNASDQDAYSGGWIYRPDAGASDRLRALPPQGSFNTQTGALIPAREWAVAPTNGETYHVYAMLPPRSQPGQVESWQRLVNRALGNLGTVVELPVGTGGTGARYFPLRPPAITLVAAIVVAGGSGATVTTPSGWTLRSTINLSTTIQLVIYTRRQLLTDPIEWEVTFDTTRVATGMVMAYVDANPTSPQDATGSATATAVTVTAPSVTTVAAGERVLRVVAADGPAAYSGPTSPKLQLRADATLIDGAANQGIALFDQEVAGAGASGTAVLTASQSRGQIAVTIALARRDTQHRTVYAGSSIAYTPAAGATSITLTRPLNLPHDEWIPNRQAVRKVMVRRYEDESSELASAEPWELDMSKRGRWWRINEGENSLRLSYAPTTGQEVVVEVQRPYPPLVADNDVTTCDLERLVLRTRVEFYSYLNSVPQSRGKYASELVQALEEWRAREADVRPQLAMVRP